MTGLWIWLCAALAAPLTADEAVERSLERSVEVASAGAEVEAARGRARATALFRSDPTVQGQWAALGEAHGISVSQPVSITGAGLAARRSARAQIGSAESTETRTRLEIAAATRLAWARAVEARQQVDLARQALALATRLREGAEARESTGDGSLLDARLARLQESEARSTWMLAVADEGQRLAALAAWTGIGPDALELPVDPLDAMGPVEVGASTRSDLEAAREAAEAARASLASERAGTLPPLKLGAFYEEEGDALRLGPTVAVTVPLWSRNADGRASARSAVEVAESRVAERERVVDAEQSATSRVMGVLEGSLDGADPRREAEAALESVAIGFERGELGLLTAGLLRQQILEAQLAWLVGRRVRAEARIRAALAHDAPALLGG